MYDRETDRLAPIASVGVGPAFAQIRLRPGEGISGTAFAQRRLIRTGGRDAAAALRTTLRPEDEALLAQAAGPRRLMHSVSVPLTTQGGETVGVLTVGSNQADFSDDDVTLIEGVASQLAVALDNVRLYEQVRTQADELTFALESLKHAQVQVVQQERLRALGQMSAGIAHDFNNALAPVIGFSELLLAVPAALNDTAKTRHYLELIHTGATDAACVVRRLREFYRPHDPGDALLPVDLRTVVQETVALTRPKWKDQAQALGRDIEVVTELDPVPAITGDTASLREALTNVLFNAVDALPAGGTIMVRTRLVHDVVLVEVADDGVGMPEDIRQRCMEPFFSTKGQHGTGLGLAMVHGIVERHAAHWR